MPAEVFRSYDIRGLAVGELSADLFFQIGRAFPLMLPTDLPRRVCVGHDTRTHAKPFADALIQGLLESGCDVTFLGPTTTPMVYWAEHYLGSVSAGLMVTGSHTGPDRNGLKMSVGKRPFYGKDIQRLKHAIESGTNPKTQKGELTHQGLRTQYVKSLVADFDLQISQPIVWDLGGGATSFLAQQLQQALPSNHHFINTTPQGKPARSFDPTAPKALDGLIQTMQQKNATLGMAFDGDGDRLVVIDKEGDVWNGDQLFLLFAQNQNSNAPCVVDIKTSPLLTKFLEKKRPVLVSPTGHVHVKTLMSREGATLGGEVSGHFFFKDTHPGFDDGLYAAFRLLEVLSRNTIDIVSWKKALPKRFSTPEIRIPLAPKKQKFFLDMLKSHAQKSGAHICTIDGLLVSEDHGWHIARPSQTEPVLVLRWEGQTQEYYLSTQRLFGRMLSKIGEGMEFFRDLC